MGETALKILLSALPVLILVSSTIMALVESNWDVEAAIFGNIPEVMKNIAVEIREDAFKVKDISLSGDMVEVTAEFTSPFSFPVTIKDVTFEAVSGKESTTLKLENEVVVPPNGVKEIKLSGKAIIPSEKVEFTNFRVVVEFYGVTLEVSQP
jgi:hypothetical protein